MTKVNEDTKINNKWTPTTRDGLYIQNLPKNMDQAREYLDSKISNPPKF